MSLIQLVIGRETGTFGTFEVTEGNVTKNRRPILQFFNATSALVPMDARSLFTTPVEHMSFDELLMALSSASIAIKYVESIQKFMDPKARFKEWLDGTLNPGDFGLSLTSEELAVPGAFMTAKAKFVDLFTPPKPVLTAGGVDTVELFGSDNAVVIDEWRTGKRATLPVSVRNKIGTGTNQRTHGLLRITRLGTAYKVVNDRGHSISRTRFLASYRDYMKPAWDSGREGQLSTFRVEAREHDYSYGSNRQNVTVYPDYVTIGCQSVPRAEIERIVCEFEKLGITK